MMARRSVLGVWAVGAGAFALRGCDVGPAQASDLAGGPADGGVRPVGQDPARAPLDVSVTGDLVQSGTAMVATVPGATISLDGIACRADAAGRAVIGFDRDALPVATLEVRAPDGREASRSLAIAPKTWRVMRISGLPPSRVTPPVEAMARIERESNLKQRAFASEDTLATGYLEPFDWPLASIRVTSPWGAQRSLNGDLQRPHYGIDLGAPAGTPVRAPAPGLVILAEPDMYFEGGMVGIDHGQGLITLYLHMSRLDVRQGQRLARGERIGLVGARGRATGPHLCWRMRWRGRQCDPSLRTV
jgi:murein DD-endopeptidase MepM/ murein hydrolase activator NlpD